MIRRQHILKLEEIDRRHQDLFLEAVDRSRDLHHPWTTPADTPQLFREHLKKHRSDKNYSLLAFTDEGGLVACININEIVRGAFQSAYLGYYAFQPYAGKGLMFRAMQLAIAYAFEELGLHRLEANIQPENVRSKNLAAALGFRLEGYSPRYLNIGGQWKDHERYALTVEDVE